MITLDTTALLSTTHRLGAQIATHMQSPDENQLWCPGPSLWRLISEHVPGSELSRIHAALGHSLVGMYTEMHAENKNQPFKPSGASCASTLWFYVAIISPTSAFPGKDILAEMWHKMWQESRGGNHGSRAATSLPRQQGPSLADPPAVKELLRAEVKMLLQTLRERASRGGSRDGDELLFGYKPETVNYALGHLDNCYSNCAIPGDSDNETRTSSQCSVRSNAEDEIEAVRDKLKVTDIDQVVDRLKAMWWVLGVLAALLALFCTLDVWYFLRAAVVIIRAWFQPPVFDITGEQVLTGRVTSHDIDMCHMNNARYLRECDFARFSLYTRNGVFKALRALRASMVVGATTIRYRRALYIGERYELRSRIVTWDDKAFFLEQRFVSTKDGLVCAVMYCKQSVIRSSPDKIMQHLCKRKVECPEFPGDLQHWVNFISASSQALRAESGLDDKRK
ncbi:hypothetical protein INR49_013263 [Caranx melampygus]|nr:hypothetical protein INR49_013263 [Caranx melampygus]